MWTTLAPLLIALVTFAIEWLRKRNAITEQEYTQTIGAMNEALNRAKAAKAIDADAANLSDDWLSPGDKQRGDASDTKEGGGQ